MLVPTRPGGAGVRAPAVLPAVATVVAFCASVGLDLVAPGAGPGIELAPGPGWPYAGIGLVFAACAAIVLASGRGATFALVFGWLALFWGLDGLSQSYVRFAIRADQALTGADAALWFLNRFGAFLPMTVALLLLIFPTGRLLEGWWGRAGRVTLVLMTGSAVLIAVAPSNGRVSDVRLPPGVDVEQGSVPMPAWLVDVLLPVTLGVTLLGLLVGMASVVVRYRRSGGIERDRMRWLLWSVQAMAAVLALVLVSALGGFAEIAVTALACLPPIAMTIGIVNPALVSVQDLLVRTCVYGGLSLAIILVDLAALRVLTDLLGTRLDEHQVVLVVLLLSAVLYNPLRAWIWAFVRRLVLGERDDPYDVVAGLASALESVDEGHEQLAAVAGAVAAAFGIGFVSVEISRPGGQRTVATHGTRPQETRSLPITYRGAEVGRLELPQRGIRGRLSPRDQRLLGDLVRQAATAVRTSLLAEELQDNRQRLVVAREEERRRIRNELHEDLGPTVGGLVHQIEAAGLLVAARPEAAKEKIEATSARLRAVVADVRRVVHDLRPPALDDRGLLGALRQQAERSDATGLVVEVQGDGVEPLPAAVEVAAYRIAEEALRNVVAHAHADRCTVRLVREATELVVEVSDDGVGIDEAVTAGQGLTTLRARAAELGGSCEVVRPASGGTVVSGRLPLREAAR